MIFVYIIEATFVHFFGEDQVKGNLITEFYIKNARILKFHINLFTLGKVL